MVDAARTRMKPTLALRAGGLARGLPLLVLIVSMAIPWFRAGDHPLYSPDEGRYGTVSMHMADGGNWIVPQFRGAAHLSKPPLTYWSQAAALRALGHTELAVRLPSLLACSLTLLLLYLTTRRIGGDIAAALAAGTLAMMPLFVLVGRLGTTDALLTLFWFAALASGYFAITTGHRRWAAAMWSAIALAWLTKGPLALVPLGILLLWLIAGGRRRDVRRLRLVFGLPLSVVPLLAWIGSVMRLHPEAMGVWRDEIVHHVGGGNVAHPEPFWYFIPVFLAGLFPATAMLALPGWNLEWRAARRKLRSGAGSCLWSLAVIGPLVLFSFMSGKLATYILPLCPPLALLNGLMLRRWLGGVADRRRHGRPPEVVATLGVMVVLMIAALIGGAALLDGRLLRWTPALLALPAACAWLWWVWKRRPAQRPSALLAVWAAWMIVWATIFTMEAVGLRRYDAAALVRRLCDQTGNARPCIYTFGFSDPTLSFYNHREARRVHDDGGLAAIIAEHARGEPIALLIDDGSLEQYRQREGGLIEAFARVGTWQRTLTDTAGIYLPVSGDTHATPDQQGSVGGAVSGQGGDGTGAEGDGRLTHGDATGFAEGAVAESTPDVATK
jgi:4-amino-4-deoxy-L-arabinose transferase-like glycosyltransferase